MEQPTRCNLSTLACLARHAGAMATAFNHISDELSEGTYNALMRIHNGVNDKACAQLRKETSHWLDVYCGELALYRKAMEALPQPMGREDVETLIEETIKRYSENT